MKEKFFRIFSPEIRYILLLFVVTRITLLCIGTISMNELTLHGCGKPTSKQIEEYADIWSFVFFNLGMKY